MLVVCPACGIHFRVKASDGSPRVKLIANDVIGILHKTRSVQKTAKHFKCARYTIDLACKKWGIDPKEITGRKYYGFLTMYPKN